MSIWETASSLLHKYHTNDPFELCRLLGIIVIKEPLGTVRGYYSRSHRTKVIHINEALSPERQHFTCAHELGHAVMHPSANTPFLREHTLFSVDKLEVQANRFAVCLCYPSEYLTAEYEGCSVYDIAQALQLPPELVAYSLGTNL